jgi:hypothetical protein
MERANTADLILHSQTLREMRASEHQYNKLLAAQVLSSSCANSGVVVQTPPKTRAQIPDDRFRHILRLRMGVPCAMPLAQWRCNCSAHAGPRHGEFAERAAEANGPDLAAGSFAEEPLHGLFCRRRWRRVMYRHDNMRDALCRELRRFPQVQATIEPRMENPQGAADQRRGDIKVHKDGTTWVLDVGVVCPGTRRHTNAGADTTPGVAAEEYSATKSARYADQHNFVPFIVETGGRVNYAGIQFLDVLSGVAGLANAAPVLVDGRPPRFGAVALAHRRKRAALSGVLRELTLQQGFMLAQIVEEIPARDNAAEGRAGGERINGGTGGGGGGGGGG